MSTGNLQDVKEIDGDAIRTDLHARVSYILDFVGFNENDVKALRIAGPIIRPHISLLVDAVYGKLLSYDVTREAFVESKNKHLNKEERLMTVTPKSDRMKYFKDFFRHWLLKIFICDWEDLQTFAYFDRVGIAHIGGSGFRHREDRGKYAVDYMHIGLLLGFLSEAVTKKILAVDSISLAEKTQVLGAFTKVMWIQNDLMSRHYVCPVTPSAVPIPHPAAYHAHMADMPRCPFSASSSKPVEEEEGAEVEPWSDDSDNDENFASSDEEGTKLPTPATARSGPLPKVSEEKLGSSLLVEEKMMATHITP
ncbi:hypothetical protein FRC03_000447 [Tulasnella sp. 419]|nr:hypothetical protein FRC03_000447 [Tulasnella sp. 419]